MIRKKCKHCGKSFLAYYRSGKYCSPECRHKHFNDKRNDRARLLAEFGNHCHRCPPGSDGEPVYSCYDPELDCRVLLCARHRSLLNSSQTSPEARKRQLDGWPVRLRKRSGS